MNLEVPLSVVGLWLLFKLVKLLVGVLCFGEGLDADELARQQRKRDFEAWALKAGGTRAEPQGSGTVKQVARRRTSPSDDTLDDDLRY